jgi:DNA-binding transcriptional regulator LsrR (DeoR family)
MTDLTVKQKKEWAKLLYTKEHLTQAEIAEKVGVSRVSMSRWVTAEKWEMLKVSISMTREEQLRNMYRQLTELNKVILERPPGERSPLPAEAENQLRISKSIKLLETEAGISDIISTSIRFIDFVRGIDKQRAELAREITLLFDLFIKQYL